MKLEMKGGLPTHEMGDEELRKHKYLKKEKKKRKKKAL